MKTTFSILAGLLLGALAIEPSFAVAPEANASSIAMSQAAVEDAGHARIPVVIWAPVTGDKLPLIVMSHGTGAGPLAHVDTAEALANAGFVVVSPMHPGDNFQDEASVGKPQWFVDRSRHVSKVLDHMLGQWDGRMRLDPSQIGMFGMSAGATTALISAGGQLNLASVDGHCKKQPEFVCKIMAPASPKTATTTVVREPRIGAEVLVAPGLGFAFEPNGLNDVKIPIQLWSGLADETVPYATNAGVIRKLLTGHVEFHSVENAVHLSFLAPCTPESPPFICKDNPGFNRSAFHETFNRSVVDFYRAHLRAAPARDGK